MAVDSPAFSMCLETLLVVQVIPGDTVICCGLICPSLQSKFPHVRWYIWGRSGHRLVQGFIGPEFVGVGGGVKLVAVEAPLGHVLVQDGDEPLGVVAPDETASSWTMMYSRHRGGFLTSLSCVQPSHS